MSSGALWIALHCNLHDLCLLSEKILEEGFCHFASSRHRRLNALHIIAMLRKHFEEWEGLDDCPNASKLLGPDAFKDRPNDQLQLSRVAVVAEQAQYPVCPTASCGHVGIIDHADQDFLRLTSGKKIA